MDRISKLFVFGVLLLSILTFGVWCDHGIGTAWDHVVSLLIVSCPCALGIATPITLSLASSRAARRGLLLRDGGSLERLATIREVVFDKTGTLTQGELGIASIKTLSSRYGSEWIWSAIAGLEHHVDHPIASAFRNAVESKGIRPLPLTERSVVHGGGVEGLEPDGTTIRIGSLRWLQSNNVSCENYQEVVSAHNREGLSTVGFSVGLELVAIVGLTDLVRPEARAVVHELTQRGIVVSILSGDTLCSVVRVGKELGVAAAHCFGERSPEEKALFIEERGDHVAFVGDGANDGLALSRATVGIGIRGGAEIAMSVSDIFLLQPNLALIIDAINGAQATLHQVHRHLGISLFYNCTAATLAVLGHVTPLVAAIVMPLSSLSVILSSLWRPPFRGVRV